VERLDTEMREAPEGDGDAARLANGAWTVIVGFAVASEYDGGGAWLSEIGTDAGGTGVVGRPDALCEDKLLLVLRLLPFRDSFPFTESKRDALPIVTAAVG